MDVPMIVPHDTPVIVLDVHGLIGPALLYIGSYQVIYIVIKTFKALISPMF